MAVMHDGPPRGGPFLSSVPDPGARRRRLLFRGELARTLRIALPLIVSQLGHIGMSTADTVMVGPLGATPLAAVGVGSAVHVAVAMLLTGTIIGMAPLVSQAFGAGELDRCRRIMIQGLWLALLLSIPLAIFSLAGEPITRALGQKPEVATLAGGYMRALAWGSPPLLLFMAFRQYLDAMGRPTPTMMITFIGLSANVVANRVFIYGLGDLVPAMGAVGTGHASSLTRWLMLFAMLIYLARHPELEPFRRGALAPVWAQVRRIARIGFPVGSQIAMEVGLFSLAAVMMGWFGPYELAAHQVTINIAATTFMVGLGAGLAGSVRVGQHIGAQRPRMARRAVLATYLLSVGFMALCALVFVAAPEALIRLYTDDPQIVRIGSTLLLIAAAFQVFDGGQVAGMSVLRGAADTRAPMVVAGIGYWAIGMPVAYLLGFHTPLGAVGVWIGLSLALAAVALMLVVRVRRVLWRARIARA